MNDAAPTTRGAVSTALLQEITAKVRRHGLIVWLDRNGDYTRFVDELALTQPKSAFPVLAFRGSFLELLFALEPYGSGLDNPKLLLHVPGFDEQTLRATPLLELHEMGTDYKKALDTLVREACTGRVAPAEVDKLLAKGTTLEDADTWLSSAAARSGFGLAAKLEEIGPRLLVEALADPPSLDKHAASDEELAVVMDYVHRLTGLDKSWDTFFPPHKEKLRDRLLHQLAGWILAVEYVHDLRRPPHLEALQPLKKLSAPLVKACSDLATKLRKDHPAAYERIADEVEGLLTVEIEAMSPDDLGHIDTFREEESRVLTGAVAALRKGEWQKAKAWWEARQGSFWLQREPKRRWEWTLVGDATELCAALAKHAHPFDGAKSLDEATERYATGAYEVDLAHRRFEQRRLALLDSSMTHHGALREMLSDLRGEYRKWADALAKSFAALCKEHGFLPSPELLQRNLYEQAVHPLTLDGEKVAVFLIDAFRFEMAKELAAELGGSGTVVRLEPRLAELPTITAVGMNALPPVTKSDRLHVAGIFKGFKTGELTVHDPETRSRVMGQRSTGAPALWYKLHEMADSNAAELTKKVAKAKLVVVCSTEIDDAGEANVGLATFDTLLRQIKTAWHHLQLAGVKSFVFTADHGFLLQDETTQIRTFGKARDPQRRHVLDEHPRSEAGMVYVPLSTLGYDGMSGYLLFLEDTAVFKTGNPGATFVHGGNSPQERIIPVLTVTKKRAEHAGLSAYDIETQTLDDALGLHRLCVRVVLAKGAVSSLAFAAARTIDLALRVPDGVTVILKDATGGAKLKSGRIEFPVGDAWCEVFFGLEGAQDARVRVEVHHPDNVEKVKSATPDVWYSVIGAKKAPDKASPTQGAWSGSVVDDAVRKVFEHIDKHGAITEPEVTAFLGSPRAFRRFSLEFDALAAKLPFKVRIEASEGGKRYVKGDPK